MIADDLQQVVERLARARAESAIAAPTRFLIISAIVCGTVTIELAKMTGMTPPVLTRSGR